MLEHSLTMLWVKICHHCFGEPVFALRVGNNVDEDHALILYKRMLSFQALVDLDTDRDDKFKLKSRSSSC